MLQDTDWIYAIMILEYKSIFPLLQHIQSTFNGSNIFGTIVFEPSVLES